METKKRKNERYGNIKVPSEHYINSLVKNIMSDENKTQKKPKIKKNKFVKKSEIHKSKKSKTNKINRPHHKSSIKKHKSIASKIQTKKKKEIVIKKEKPITEHKEIKQIVKIKKEKPISHKCIRVPAGIKGFDKLIEGGFEKNSTNLVVGGPGSGKTIFAMQYMMDGLRNGESCLFITFEENKDSFFHNMQGFKWDLEYYEKKGLFTFLNYTPSKVKSMLEEGGGLIENVIIKNNVTRLVIDSMTSFTLLFNDELQKREASLELFNMIKKWNCTSLITFEGTPSGEQYRALEFESDSIILIQFNREKALRERQIEILKMRGTNHSKGLYKFEINKSGIVVSKKPIKKGA